jgi:SprT protein
MQQSPDISKVLAKYMPIIAVPFIVNWVSEQPTSIKITAKRKTVLGTYMSPANETDRHTITINGDLNPYSFLLTFVHEIAHLKVWLKHKNNVQPHGKEWQRTYRNLLAKVLHVFPTDAANAISNYMLSPTAATCRDEDLYKALKKYDIKKTEHILLEELPEHAIFSVEDGRVFKKGQKLRKFFRCMDMKTNHIYRVSAMMEVKEVK